MPRTVPISCEVWDQLKHLREDREKLKEVITGLPKSSKLSSKFF